MTRSLSGRLLIGIVSLVVVGLLVANVATYAALQSFLLSRIDSQLTSGRPSAVGVLGGPGPERNAAGQFPIGTVVELLRPDGTEIGNPLRYDFPSSTSTAVPVRPSALPSATEQHPALLTLAGTAGVSQYRAAIWPEDSFQGNYVLLAIPLNDVNATLGQLLLLEVLISLGVVAATAALALIIIRIGLRPLQRMALVAQDIAAGDLTRRVEPATRDTEIGRLGIALNGMLSQIEAAFGERTRSEQRLRRFIADASHELRTPLTSVRGYAEMLRRGAQESPEDASIARRRIEEESVRMSLMVDDMLVLARLGQGRPLEQAPVDLQSIARRSRGCPRRRTPAPHHPRGPSVSGDHRRRHPPATGGGQPDAQRPGPHTAGQRDRGGPGSSQRSGDDVGGRPRAGAEAGRRRPRLRALLPGRRQP